VADVVRLVLIAGALVASVRARYAQGVVIAGCSALLLGVEIFFALRFPRQTGQLEVAFGAIFLGPTAMPHDPPFGASKWLMDPCHHLATALLATLGARRAFGVASALHPEGLASRRLDRAGLWFVALAVLAGLLSISGVIGHMFGEAE
jgi:hypothetical protein